MGVSTKSRYALRLLTRLARSPAGSAATVETLATQEGISPDYAAQIMMAMRRSGIVASRRGVGGGVSLARPASDISVDKVIEAAEGPLEVADCQKKGAVCHRSETCAMHAMWAEGTRQVRAYFEGISLARLASQTESLESKRTTTFDI